MTTRVLLWNLPELSAQIVAEIAAADPSLELIHAHRGYPDLLVAIRELAPDVVVSEESVHATDESRPAPDALGTLPRFVELTRAGCAAVVYELGATPVALEEQCVERLLAALRSTPSPTESAVSSTARQE